MQKLYLPLLIMVISIFSFSNTAHAQKREGGNNGREGGSLKREGGSREAIRNTPRMDARNSTVLNRQSQPDRKFNQPNANNTPVERNFNTIRRGNNRPVQNSNTINNRPVNNSNNGLRPANANRPGVGTSYNNRPGYATVSRPAYRPVYGPARPVYNAYNPGWRYGYLPRRNSYFHSLPSTYLSINFGGFGYRYWDGVYYRPYNNLFTVIAPPVGIFINVLPLGYRTLYVREHPYYYYNGTYYDHRENNYYVVSPPIGSVVESLPAGYETVVIDGETFYTIDGAQYKPVVKENGEIWYEVIKAN